MKIDSSLSKLITFPRIIPKTFLNSIIKVNNNNFLVLPCQAPSGHSLYYIIIKLHIHYSNPERSKYDNNNCVYVTVCEGGGRRWRGAKPMVTPVHRFQAVECVTGQYAHSHIRRPTRHAYPPQPSYRYSLPYMTSCIIG